MAEACPENQSHARRLEVALRALVLLLARQAAAEFIAASAEQAEVATRSPEDSD